MADPASNGERSRYAERAAAGRIGVTVELPRDLYERLKRAVVDEERSQGAIIRVALREHFRWGDALTAAIAAAQAAAIAAAQTAAPEPPTRPISA